MIRRPSRLAYVPAILGALVVGLVAISSTTGTPPRQDEGQSGRYRVDISDRYVVVIDTETGHCWSRSPAGAGGWIDLGSPAHDRQD